MEEGVGGKGFGERFWGEGSRVNFFCCKHPNSEMQRADLGINHKAVLFTTYIMSALQLEVVAKTSEVETKTAEVVAATLEVRRKSAYVIEMACAGGTTEQLGSLQEELIHESEQLSLDCIELDDCNVALKSLTERAFQF